MVFCVFKSYILVSLDALTIFFSYFGFWCALNLRHSTFYFELVWVIWNKLLVLVCYRQLRLFTDTQSKIFWGYQSFFLVFLTKLRRTLERSIWDIILIKILRIILFGCYFWLSLHLLLLNLFHNILLKWYGYLFGIALHFLLLNSPTFDGLLALAIIYSNVSTRLVLLRILPRVYNFLTESLCRVQGYLVTRLRCCLLVSLKILLAQKHLDCLLICRLVWIFYFLWDQAPLRLEMMGLSIIIHSELLLF